jgi:alkylglycerol monooxygenase
LLGVPASVVAVVAPLHLFAQFWYHTQHINKMGFLEKIIVTPSHHRVHHAINKEYLDKNYGQIFIFWDKWFGTFQEELPDVKPVYGITRPVQTWNPIKINFMHLWLLVKDAWNTKSWKDKFRIWMMPTGWRPADVAEKYPVYKIEDVYNFEKYATRTKPAFICMGMGTDHCDAVIAELFFRAYCSNRQSGHFYLWWFYYSLRIRFY